LTTDARWKGTRDALPGWGELVQHALAALFFSYVLLLCVRPLADPDLWWHLTTGRWILDTRSLPGADGTDPFSYGSPDPLPEAAVAGLQSQWLGQVLLYLGFTAGGFAGFSVMRAILVVLPFVVMYAWYAGREGIAPLAALAALAFPPLFFGAYLSYAFERPQVFSFYGALAAYALMRAIGRGWGGWGAVALLAALMALWGNLHGGYIIGVLIVLACGGGALGVWLLGLRGWGGWAEGRAERPLLLASAVGAGLVASGFNRGGYGMLSGWVQRGLGLVTTVGEEAVREVKGLVVSEVLEYKPLWFFSGELRYTWPAYLAAFYILVAVFLLLKYAVRRRIDVPEALVAVLILAFGTWYARGISFALLLGPAMVLEGLKAVRGRRAAGFAVALLPVALAISLAADIHRHAPGGLRPSVPPPSWVDPTYPEDALRFIEDRGVAGPVMNDLRWGGYMLFRLHPRYRDFVDGRMVSMEVLARYVAMTRGAPGGLALLDDYGVNAILVRVAAEENGVFSPFVNSLLSDGGARDWLPVYHQGNSVIFVRNAERNGGLIACCAVGREAVFIEALLMAERVLADRPTSLGALLSKAIALAELGKLDEAEKLLGSVPGMTESKMRIGERIRALRVKLKK
jgi:hypothetical protein